MRRASTRHIATSSATAATPAAIGAPRSQSLMQPAGTSLMNHPSVNPVANSTGTARSVVNGADRTAVPSSVASAPISMIIPKPLLNGSVQSVCVCKTLRRADHESDACYSWRLVGCTIPSDFHSSIATREPTAITRSPVGLARMTNDCCMLWLISH